MTLARKRIFLPGYPYLWFRIVYSTPSYEFMSHGLAENDTETLVQYGEENGDLIYPKPSLLCYMNC